MKPKKYIRKKSLAKTVYKKAFRATEKSLIAAVNRRDKKCQLCGSQQILQADHCFSRTVKALFFDIRNMTLLCSGCHTKKTFTIKGHEKALDELVREREGAYKHTLDELEQLKTSLNGMFREKSGESGKCGVTPL